MAIGRAMVVQNHSSTVALAEVGNRLDQIRSELPSEAESSVVQVQRADRLYATFYVSVTSETMSSPQLTDYLPREIQPQLSALPDVRRAAVEGGSPQAMRIWLDAQRLAAFDIAPEKVESRWSDRADHCRLGLETANPGSC